MRFGLTEYSDGSAVTPEDRRIHFALGIAAVAVALLIAIAGAVLVIGALS